MGYVKLGILNFLHHSVVFLSQSILLYPDKLFLLILLRPGRINPHVVHQHLRGQGAYAVGRAAARSRGGFQSQL